MIPRIFDESPRKVGQSWPTLEEERFLPSDERQRQIDMGRAATQRLRVAGNKALDRLNRNRTT